MKKTSMSSPAESLGYIKCDQLNSPTPIRSPINSIRRKLEDLQLISITRNHTENQNCKTYHTAESELQKYRTGNQTAKPYWKSQPQKRLRES